MLTVIDVSVGGRPWWAAGRGEARAGPDSKGVRRVNAVALRGVECGQHAEFGSSVPCEQAGVESICYVFGVYEWRTCVQVSLVIMYVMID